MEGMRSIAKIQIDRCFLDAAIKINPMHLTFPCVDARICNICNKCCCKHKQVCLTILDNGSGVMGCAFASTHDVPSETKLNSTNDDEVQSSVPKPQAIPKRKRVVQWASPLETQYEYEQQTYHDSNPIPFGPNRRRFNRGSNVPLCKFCRSNGETKSFYKGHPLMEDGIVCCPVLRNYTCPICKATGDTAHTLKNCPDRQYYPKEYTSIRNAVGNPTILRY